MRKAPKMTKADELYLKKFMAAREAAEIANVEQTYIEEKKIREAARREYPPDPFEDGKVNITVNSRLYLERNKHLKPEQVQFRGPGGEKVSITDQVFGEQKYFRQKDDTAKDKNMEDYVMGNWESTAFVGSGGRKLPSKTAKQKANTGNVVPFFPTDWKKNANDVFNLILNGQEGTEDVYDEVTHAAIHRKTDDQSVAPFLINMGKKAITGDRPTSGKHFAREHKFAKRKGDLEIPNHDPILSNVAKNYETSKKVEGLLNRLAGYMAGEIPDNDDLDNLLGDKDEKTGLDDGVTEN